MKVIVLLFTTILPLLSLSNGFSGFQLPFKVSTTTSNFMIGVTAVAGALIYFQRGQIIPVIAAPVLIGVVVGSFIGSKTLMVSKTKKLKTFFAIVITLLSIYMMYNGVAKNFQ